MTRWPTSPSTFQVKTRRPDADLRCREPRAGGGEHRVGQVGDELAELAVEVVDLDRALAQHGITEEADGLDGHGVSLGSRLDLMIGQWPSLGRRRR